MNKIFKLIDNLLWNDFSKKKPTKKGWYSCTVEVEGFQRYVMNLYWHPDIKRFKDNIRQSVFDTYDVFGDSNTKLYTIPLCDRTDSVKAWRKLPNTYMKGFVKEEN